MAVLRLITAFSFDKNGPVAEWLGRALQKLPQQFESARDLRNSSLEKEGCFYLHSTGKYANKKKAVKAFSYQKVSANFVKRSLKFIKVHFLFLRQAPVSLPQVPATLPYLLLLIYTF